MAARVPNEQLEFWAQVAQKYDRVVDLQIGGKTRSMVRDRLARESKLGKLAEFGCGTGYYTQILASKADSIVATDLSPEMLALARDRIRTANVTFQTEDVQKTSFHDEVFDSVFMSLVIHFTEHEKTLSEMRRILKPGGTLIISNIDPGELTRLERLRCMIRILYHGLTGYRMKPPKGFGRNVIAEKQLCDLLLRVGFEVVSSELIKDSSRSSNIPVGYIRAIKV